MLDDRVPSESIPEAAQETTAQQTAQQPAPEPTTTGAQAPADATAPETAQATVEAVPIPQATVEAPTGPVTPLEGLRVRQITETQPEPVLGSVAADQGEGGFLFEAMFTPWGGGVKSIQLVNYVEEVDDDSPYVVLEQLQGQGQAAYSYPMAANWIDINGARLPLSNQRWRVSGATATSVTFTLEIEDADGA
ncbi:MAG: hypothetical protein ACYTGQ_14975, partial [Planctomycetota bacterium]